MASKETALTMVQLNIKTVGKKDTVSNVAVCKFEADLDETKPAPHVTAWDSDEFDRLTVSMEGCEDVKFEGLTTKCDAEKGTIVYKCERTFDAEIDLETDGAFMTLVRMKSAGAEAVSGKLSPEAGKEKLPL
jgi:hypothetical protein